MTKEQFISGTPFRVKGKTYKGSCTFTYDSKCISKQIRSSGDEEKVIIDQYHCNVEKIGKVGFEGFAYIMEKLVKVKYRFEDLVEFLPQEA